MPSLEWMDNGERPFAYSASTIPKDLYGIEWGDPELGGWRYALHRIVHRGTSPGPPYKVVDRYIRAYLSPAATVIEIGCGGGRWTRYLVGARKLIALDINPIFFAALRARSPQAPPEFS
jgi:SAM-dependent methyltransferase